MLKESDLVPAPVPEYLYRLESYWYDSPTPHLRMHKFLVVKETPAGKWINDYGGRRWVSNTTRKRFAHPTEDEAREAYRHRKLAYVRHSRDRLRRAEAELAAVTTETPKENICFLNPTW